MSALEINFASLRKGTRILADERISICPMCARKGIARRRQMSSGKDTVVMFHKVRIRTLGRLPLGLSVTDSCSWVEDGAK